MNSEKTSKGLEGTPLGEYAKAKKDDRTIKADGQKISVEQTEKGTQFSGLAKKDDPFEDLGYRRK